MNLRLRCAAVTDVGTFREHNEDGFLVLNDLGVAVVVDGMGGHNAGDVASAIAAECLERAFRTAPRGWLARLFDRFRQQPTKLQKLIEAVEGANRAVFLESRRRPECAGMGTTIVALWLDGDTHIAHVGDSRVYRFRDGVLEQITDDHSLLNEHLRQGLITEADVATYPHKNIIVRALGLLPRVVVDGVSDAPKVGDRYLLCSDGLTDYVDDASICAKLEAEADPEVAARALIDLALAAGGLDNVTVVIAQVEVEDS